MPNPTLVIECIDKLRAAAAQRTAARAKLANPELAPKDRERIEGEVGRANRSIERCAERINQDLRKAADKRVRIRRPAGLESIQDRSLREYVDNVRRTIDKLNAGIASGRGNNGLQLRRIKAQKDQAKKLDDGAAKSQSTIGVEGEKLARREREAKQRLDQATAQLEKLERESRRVEDDKKKLDEERYKIDRLENTGKLDARATEQKAKLGRLNVRLLDELRRMKTAVRTANQAVEATRAELAELQRARKQLAAAGEKEKARRDAIGKSLKDLKDAEATAGRHGLKT
jgi:hypothetical protein